MEADTKVFYNYAKLWRKGELRTVIIDAKDTDVVFFAAHVAHEIPGVLGKCMSVPILLEIHFDGALIYSLFYNSIFPQTQYISFFSFLWLKKKKAVFNWKELPPAEMEKVIIPLYVHSGADGVPTCLGQGGEKSTGGNFITEQWVRSDFTSAMEFYFYNFFCLCLFH